MKTMLMAVVVIGIWLAPNAYADPQDQAFLSFLAAHHVAVDSNTAINAGHLACAQIAQGEDPNVVSDVVSKLVPAVNGNEYWITAAARRTYCPGP
jgi:hypothetical protein